MKKDFFIMILLLVSLLSYFQDHIHKTIRIEIDPIIIRLLPTMKQNGKAWTTSSIAKLRRHFCLPIWIQLTTTATVVLVVRRRQLLGKEFDVPHKTWCPVAENWDYFWRAGPQQNGSDRNENLRS